jgi:wobble nucleotide-excising tRNase
MSDPQKIANFDSLGDLVIRLRDDLNDKDFVLIYAYNGTGKTRLSMEFQDAGKAKNGGTPDTLYFNAYTQDLFVWDNDLQGDSKRLLRLNSDSKFFSAIKGFALEESIYSYLHRYTDLTFTIDYTDWTVSFRKGEAEHIKVSRGEENIFVWCLFMGICERVIEPHSSYDWVKYFYIDDPISSLDDNNAIAVASDLAKLLRTKNQIKVILSSHHPLFFNVVCNELKRMKTKCYFLHRPMGGEALTLRTTDDTPFFHHVAMLSEIRNAADSGELYTYHFNMLRSILEKTAAFFGEKKFSACLKGIDDEALYSRTLNLLSHGKYSLYEPKDMVEDNKELFRKILDNFLKRYPFHLIPTCSEAKPRNQTDHDR